MDRSDPDPAQERAAETVVVGPLRIRGRHLLLFDLGAVMLAIIGALALRFDAVGLLSTIERFTPAILLPLVIQPIVNIAFGLYRREWRYASVRELIAIAAAVATGAVLSQVGMLFLIAVSAPGTTGLPRSFVPLVAMLSLILIGGGRFAVRVWWDSLGPRRADRDRAIDSLIYGAGEAGAAIARMALRDPAMRVRVVGVLDDDSRKHGSRLLGQRILGGIDDLPAAVDRTDARQLVVAMPSASGQVVRRAVEAAQDLGLEVRIVPPLLELLEAPERLGRLRPVKVDDLLRREPVRTDLEELAAYLNGAVVMVTGAGGSIGGELARQIGRLGPRRLVLLDNNESALWSIERDLRDASVDPVPVPVMADVRSLPAIERAIRTNQPDVVFHAAAMKHVPICELHPSEAVLTNVVGTRNLLQACDQYAVRRYVLISTDKAVHPASVMGATKRVAEMLVLATAEAADRAHMAVRFGNVLGSSGSVVPIFQRQLEAGLPLTITHPDATRYFMTIPEAVSLIIQAGADRGTGEIYVLDMGEPVRIVDLARDMIRLSGIDPASVEFSYTGLRPGERLEERLFHDHESVEGTGHDRVWRVLTPFGNADRRIPEMVADLERMALQGDDRGVRELLLQRGVLQQRQPVGAA